MGFTSAEILAMKNKMLNPQATVYCPRCGKELHYREIGNSSEVKCEKAECIKMTSRGL